MATKNISDYLHLYYGGQAFEYDENGKEYPCKIDAETFDRSENVEVIIKPILRRLDSMTEEDHIEVGKLLGYEETRTKPLHLIALKGKSFVEGYGLDRIESITVVSLITKYLLSKGFDLFGLIDDELAIDSKILKP